MDNIPSNWVLQIDLNTLRQCFQRIAVKNQNQLLVSDSQFYIEDCKREVEFPGILLKMFDDEAEVYETLYTPLTLHYRTLTQDY